MLLGIRSAWKEDIQSTAAELVYGEPLRLPGQFLSPMINKDVDMTDFADRLRNHMNKLAPQPTSWHHSSRPFYIPRDLSTATYVFLREGPVRRPLQPPYAGPYKVTRRGSKTYDILVKNKTLTVTIDRLKPAYALDDNTATPAARSPAPPIQVPADEPDTERKTRSGRTVRFPNYYRS